MILITNLILLFTLAFLILVTITMITHVILTVPWVPTNLKTAKKMIVAARLKKGDVVYDLGCGDGRLLFAAERRGAQGVGYEIAPMLYLAASLFRWLSGSRAKIRFQNLFHANLREANVIFCYLLPNIMPQLAKKIRRECRKGTRIISNTFKIKGLKPARIVPKNPVTKTPTIYIYKI